MRVKRYGALWTMYLRLSCELTYVINQVRLEAMKAAASYIVQAEEEQQKALGALMPQMLEVRAQMNVSC